MWYVGWDWADTHHDVDVLDEAGKRVGARRFPHTHDGLNELKQFLLSIATKPEELACIVAHASWIADHVPAGSRDPCLSRQPKDGEAIAQSGGSQDRSN